MEAGTTITLVGDVYTCLASGADTGGSYALFEACVPPGGGPPPHLHHREDEAFYVLEGQVEFMADGRTVRGGRGFFIHLPRERPHAFRNSGDTPARMLIWALPAGLERFFADVGHPLPGPDAAALPVTQEDIDRLLAVAPEYSLEILPPG
jgi:quercetin dioxygenase-like cupin family protein